MTNNALNHDWLFHLTKIYLNTKGTITHFITIFSVLQLNGYLINYRKLHSLLVIRWYAICSRFSSLKTWLLLHFKQNLQKFYWCTCSHFAMTTLFLIIFLFLPTIWSLIQTNFVCRSSCLCIFICFTLKFSQMCNYSNCGSSLAHRSSLFFHLHSNSMQSIIRIVSANFIF